MAERDSTRKKLEQEAAERGLLVVDAGKDCNYRIYRFVGCGHERELLTTNVRKGEVRCAECYGIADNLTQRLNNEAAEAGLRIVERNTRKTGGVHLYEFNSCGHQQEIACGMVRKRSFRCQQCLNEKLASEAKARGATIIGTPENSSYRIYKLACGHIAKKTTSSVRNMIVGKCDECIDEKHKAKAKEAAIELIGKGKNNGYRLYRLTCGHELELTVDSVKKKTFACRICDLTWPEKPSTLYLHKIVVGNMEFLKLGRSLNVVARSQRYGLPPTAKLETLKTWSFESGEACHKIEKSTLKRFKRLPTSVAKQFMTESGWTECLYADQEKAIMDSVNDSISHW